MGKSKLGEMSPEEAGRLLEKAIMYLANAGDKREEEKRKEEMGIIIKMAGGIKNIPRKTRDKVLKILEED